MTMRAIGVSRRRAYCSSSQQLDPSSVPTHWRPLNKVLGRCRSRSPHSLGIRTRTGARAEVRVEYPSSESMRHGKGVIDVSTNSSCFRVRHNETLRAYNLQASELDDVALPVHDGETSAISKGSKRDFSRSGRRLYTYSRKVTVTL